MKLPSIRQVRLDAKQAAARFPFVLFCALAGTITALILIESEPERSAGFPIIFAAVLGLPLLTASALFAEKRKWSPGFSLCGQLLGLLLLVGYAFTVPTSFPPEQAAFPMRFGLLAAGLVLLAMIAPYVKRGEPNGFWQYNKALFFRLFITAVFSVVLYGGLAIALAALDNLFGVSVPGKRYGELFALVIGLFAPWYFLAGVPKDLEGLDRNEEYPEGLRIFAQYILLSLVLVYLLILYAYLFKILLQWNWPKGWVSSLILGFSAMFISSLLLLHPIRNRSENAWVRAAGKWLYIVLVPLIVVLFLAVTERIGNYGITESRYAGIALGIWLSAQAIYFLFSTSKSIKFTIGSLCLLAFLMSFGPWGMLGVSQRSQVGRLSGLLAKNGVLVEGKVHKEHGEVSQDDAREISSIVAYLNQVHGYDGIRSWFADELGQDTLPGYAWNPAPSEVLDRMRVEFIGSRARGSGMTFSSLETEEAVEISGYDRMLRRQVITAKGAHRFDGDGISYVVGDTLDSMSVMIGNAQTGFDTVQIDVAAFAEGLLRGDGGAGPDNAHKMKPETMALAVEQNGQRIKIFFRHLSLSRRDGRTVVNSFVADMAFTVRK